MAVSVCSYSNGGFSSPPTRDGYSAPPTREGFDVTPVPSMRDGKKPPRKSTMRLKFVDGVVGAAAVELKYMPEANKGEENGWQSKCEDVKSRLAVLFNCYTMSDVIFQVGAHTIPAHKLILASASPVWYKQFFEDELADRRQSATRSPGVAESVESWFNGTTGTGGSGGASRHTMITITEVPHLSFFEFLQFLYTDNVNITLDNVLHLMLLSDTYKVAGLTDRCMDFIRHEVDPGSALRVIHITRTLLVKASMNLWKAIVAQSRATRKFQELTLAERRAKMEEADGNSSVMSSRAGSRRPSASMRSSLRGGTMRGSLRSSRNSMRSSLRSAHGFYANSEAESLAGDGDFGDAASAMDVGAGLTKKAFKMAMLSQQAEARMLFFCEEVNRKCWLTVETETGAVIQSQDMWNQDLKMVKEILRLETLSVPEIALFRSITDWAQRRCIKAGMKPTAENQREVLGIDTILLLRFPTMTPEQFQWEVVPTGLLEYEDTEQLLQSLSKRSALLGRFNGKPRDNFNFRKDSSSQSGNLVGTTQSLNERAAASNAAYEEATKTLYNAVPDDPVDTILASKLLRGYLKSKVLCDYGDTMVTVSDAELVQQAAQQAKLPPIPSPASSPQMHKTRSRSSSAATESGLSALSTPRNSVQLPAPSLLVAQRAEEASKGGNSVVPPEDFVRICQGIYVLRGTTLLEVWVEDGEVMCRDHGPSERLEDPSLEDATVQDARQILGLPECPPWGRGVALEAYLSRHEPGRPGGRS